MINFLQFRYGNRTAPIWCRIPQDTAWIPEKERKNGNVFFFGKKVKGQGDE